MSGKAVFFLSHGGYEAAWQALSTALTAVAMGDQVTLVLAFDALRAQARGRLGRPGTAKERTTARRAARINAATPSAMLTDARALGARVLACDTTVRLCGLSPAALEKAGAVDEVVGLAQLWRLTAEARVLTF